MNEKGHSWTAEEKAAVFAAVEQYHTTGRSLDWCAVGAIVGRSAKAARTQYYKLHPVRTVVCSAPAALAPLPPSVFRRPCLRCRRPFDSSDRKRNWICSSCTEQIATLGAMAA